MSGGHRLNLHADPTAGHAAFLTQLRDDVLHRLGRNVESDADRTAGGREDRRVDADHVAFDVEARAAGIALVDRRVDLNEVVIRTGADIAAAGGHDAGGHGAAESERIADREHPIADARRAVGKLHEREVLAVDLDQGKVGARIGADDLRRIGLAVVGRDLHVLGILHDVIVGDGIAVGGDEEAGALAGDDVMAATFTLAAIRHAEATEEALHRRTGRERRIVLAERRAIAGLSIFTRTEITAGFTLATMSAKPTGRCGSFCASCERFCACAGPARNAVSGVRLGATKKAAAPRPAIVVARSPNRRTDKMRRGWKITVH